MKTTTIMVTVILFIMLVTGGIFLLAERRQAAEQSLVSTPTQTPTPTPPDIKTYANERFGIAFEYPAKYFLEEKELGDAKRFHRSIILTENTGENEELRKEKPNFPREGPTAITIDIYQNTAPQQSLWQWIRGSAESNYKLGSGAYASSTIGSTEAIDYSWSGLYQGETQTFEQNGMIIAASVTYLTPEDSIRKDFSTLLQTLKLTAPTQ